MTPSTTGQLGMRTSSKRFKNEIKSMAQSSETIYELEPVTFRYKPELDPDEILQFGLVAEEVAKVDPELVERDETGKPYSVRYDAVNAMLLNAFLKEHRKVEDEASNNRQQEATINELKSALAQQQEQIALLTRSLSEQAVQIGQMNAQLTTNNSTQHLVARDQ